MNAAFVITVILVDISTCKILFTLVLLMRQTQMDKLVPQKQNIEQRRTSRSIQNFRQKWFLKIQKCFINRFSFLDDNTTLYF